jgi:hypothetical protein
VRKRAGAEPYADHQQRDEQVREERGKVLYEQGRSSSRKPLPSAVNDHRASIGPARTRKPIPFPTPRLIDPPKSSCKINAAHWPVSSSVKVRRAGAGTAASINAR